MRCMAVQVVCRRDNLPLIRCEMALLEDGANIESAVSVDVVQIRMWGGVNPL